MSIALLMPKAGLTNTEGTIYAWHVKEGSLVKKGDTVAEIETEKNTLDFLSPGDGFLHIVNPVGTELKVGTAMGYLAADSTEYEAMLKPSIQEIPETDIAGSEYPLPASAAMRPAGDIPMQLTSVSKRVYATPFARKIAGDVGIDISVIEGTGPGNRIVKKDVDRHLAALSSAVASPTARTGQKTERLPLSIPLSFVRKTTAKRMRESLQTMAQTSVMAETDVTDLTVLRSKLLKDEEIIGSRITYTDLFSLAAIKMLKKYPLANASFNNTEILTYPNVNLGMAVATDYGLMVPVVTDADLLNLTELSLALKAVVSQAREKKLQTEALAGGTFTITNMGIFDVDMFNPIVNPPQSAILGFGRIVKKPVVYQGELAVRSMMFISMTYDHRVFDGSYGGGIMGYMKTLLENPELILI